MIKAADAVERWTHQDVTGPFPLPLQTLLDLAHCHIALFLKMYIKFMLTFT